MRPSRSRLRDATVVAALLAGLLVLLVAGRLTGRSLQSGGPAAPDRTAPPAAKAPPRALPRTLPVVAAIPLPSGPPDRRHAARRAKRPTRGGRRCHLGGVLLGGGVRAREPHLQGWLLRVDPATNQVVSSAAPLGSPTAIAGRDAMPPSLLADQDLVFMSDPSTGVVWQVDPRQHQFIGSVTVIQGGPLATAAGVVWAAGASSLAPLTGPHAGGEGPHLGPHLLDPYGRRITGLAASGDALWVATSEALYRIDSRKLERRSSSRLLR